MSFAQLLRGDEHGSQLSYLSLRSNHFTDYGCHTLAQAALVGFVAYEKGASQTALLSAAGIMHRQPC